MLGAMEILKNLGSAWDTLSIQQQKYVSSGFGIHQANRLGVALKSLTGDTEEYSRVLDIANNSTGALNKKYEEYSKTIEASNQRLKVSWENLYTNILDSGMIQSVVNLITKFVDLIDSTHILQAVFVAFGVALSAHVVMGITSVIISIGGFISALVTAGVGLVQFGALAEVTFASINISMGMVAVALGVIAGAMVIYNGSLDNAREATENFNRAQKEMDVLLGEGGRGAKERADEITENAKLLAEKEVALKELIAYEKANRGNIGAFESIKNTKELFALKNEVKGLTEEQIKLGVANGDVEETLKKLNESYEKSEELVSSIEDYKQAEDNAKTAGSIKMLSERYSELNGIKNKSKAQAQEEQIVLAQLKSAMSDLGVSYETNAEGAIINLSAVNNLNDGILQTATDTKASALTAMNAEKEKLKVVLGTIKTELEARAKLAGILLGDSKAKAPYLKGSDQELSSLLSGNLSNVFNADTQGNTGFLEGQVNQYTDAIDKITTAIENVNTIATDTGKTPPKDKKETQTDILDRYKSQTNVIKELTSAISILEAKKNLQVEGSTEYLRLQANIVTGYKNQQNALKSYSDSIRTTLAKGGLKPEEIEKLNDTLRSNSSEWWALTGSIKTVYDSQKKYNDEVLKKTIEDGEKLVKVLGTDLEQATKAMQSEMEKEAKLASDAHDLEIEKAKTQLDNYEKSIKSQEDTNKLKEIENDILAENLAYQKELDKLAEERSNILANKNVRMLNANGTGFEFISDPLALKENSENIAKLAEGHNEKITDLNKNYQDEVINQSRETEKERLKLIVENAEKAKKATEDEYKDRVEALNTFNNEIKTSMENGITIQEGVFGRLLLSDNTYFSTKLAGYRQMVASINAEMAKVASASGQASGVIETQQGQMSPNQDTIKSDMLANSQAWHSASPSEKLRLQTENERLGAMIGATKSNGKWDVLKYHNGIENGLVGGFQMPKQWEQLATLAKGEGVFNQSQMNNVSRFVNSVIPKGGSSAIGGVNIYGNINLPNVSNANDFMNELNRMRKLNN